MQENSASSFILEDEELKQMISNADRIYMTFLINEHKLVDTLCKIGDTDVITSFGCESRLMASRISIIDDKLDVNWYDATYRSRIPHGMTASEHYKLHGQRDGLFKNARLALAAEIFDLFDPEWYLSNYKDVADSGLNPWYHFFVYGFKEGRKANEVQYKTARYSVSDFDAEWYANKYRDVKTSGFDPLEHYLFHGRGEGRAPNAREAERLKNAVHRPNIELAYDRILGRKPKSGELEYWSEQMLHGLSFENFFAEIAKS